MKLFMQTLLASSLACSLVLADDKKPEPPAALPKIGELKPLDTARYKALTDAGVLVMKLAKNTELLDVNFSLGSKKVTDEQLRQLASLGEYVSWLNLAGTDVKDAQLQHLTGLKNLERLHLEKTEVTDAGLAHLKGLSRLQYLNLYNTKIGDGGLDALGGLKHLGKLYLWQTAVTEGGAKKLHEKNPFLYINLGHDKVALQPINRSFEKPKEAPKKVEVFYSEVPETVEYGKHIAPVMKRSCISCHGEEKQKGKLRLDSPDWIKKGEVVVANELDDSELIARITLPHDDEDFMPPEGKGDPLNEIELATFKKWIQQGAKF